MGFVVRRAQQLTPVVSLTKIDTQLRVTTSPAVLKNGQLSKNKKRQRGVVTAQGRLTRSQQGPRMVPLAALIVQAQSNPNSRFSQLTSMRWLRRHSPFKGVSRRTGAMKMRAAISRLAKGRYSSRAFFKASWNGILTALSLKAPASHLSTATPAVPGSLTATCTIENRPGMDGRWPALDATRNAAAHRVLAPILQQAINEEFDKAMVLIDKKGWSDKKAELAKYGFNVTT